MRPIRFGPAARAEMLDAVEWYECHAPGIGEQFFAEVDRVIGRLASSPLQFPTIYKEVRRARLRRFPYSLFFRISEDGIDVIACFHSSRNPLRWHQRT